MVTHMGARATDEAGIALPTALLAMLVLLMLGGLFVAYAVPSQRGTRASVDREAGLLVAESAAELAFAALAEPTQADQPFMAPESAPMDREAAAAWATEYALAQVDTGCTAFQRTANGDGFALVDPSSASIYGVGFVPNCELRSAVRVMRVTYETRPLVALPNPVSILTESDIWFDHANARIGDGGIHANGHIFGSPGRVDGNYTASKTCNAPCTGGSDPRYVPTLHARAFWELRDNEYINPYNDPFYELCPDGGIYPGSPSAPESGFTEPCQQAEADSVTTQNPNWVWDPAARTWTWTANSAPPDGQYYVYNANLVNQMNNGLGNSARISMFAELDTGAEAGVDGSNAGSVFLTENPKLFPSWPGIGIVADVDVVVSKNVRADGDVTLVYAREQFEIDYNGAYDRIAFIARDCVLDHTEPRTCPDGSPASSADSPVDGSHVTKNAVFGSPPSGTVLIPSPGVAGVGEWQVLS